MKREYTYYDLLRTYAKAFMYIFKGLQVVHDKDFIDIPITYEKKTKMFMSLTQDENGVRPVSVTLPRMSVFQSGIAIAHQNKSNEYNRITQLAANLSNIVSLTYMPTPIVLNYTLSIWAKYHDDINQILEQIIPEFHSFVVVPLRYTKPISFDYDMPVTLDNISQDFGGEMDDNPSSSRVLTCDITFTTSAFLFKPVKTSKIIKRVIVNGLSDNSDGKNLNIFTNTTEIYPFTAHKSDDWSIKHIIDEDGKKLEYYKDK